MRHDKDDGMQKDEEEEHHHQEPSFYSHQPPSVPNATIKSMMSSYHPVPSEEWERDQSASPIQDE